MLFQPLDFKGVRLPGLRPLASLLPRKIQQIPGVMQGGIGWQGIIPSRAAKMGSIAVDKGIAKLGSPADFYRRLEPEAIAEHILETARGEIRELVERYERDAGHIGGTAHIELTELSGQAASLLRERPIVFYCRTGSRSLMAAQAFRASGYEAYTLDGGVVRGEARSPKASTWVLEVEDGLVREARFLPASSS